MQSLQSDLGHCAVTTLILLTNMQWFVKQWVSMFRVTKSRRLVDSWRLPLQALAASSCKPACRAQVGAQTETELKEKKLRVEDALNATKVCVMTSRASWPFVLQAHAIASCRMY